MYLLVEIIATTKQKTDKMVLPKISHEAEKNYLNDLAETLR